MLPPYFSNAIKDREISIYYYFSKIESQLELLSGGGWLERPKLQCQESLAELPFPSQMRQISEQISQIPFCIYLGGWGLASMYFSPCFHKANAFFENKKMLVLVLVLEYQKWIPSHLQLLCWEERCQYCILAHSSRKKALR